MSLPHITMSGNLVADPELRFTAAGKPVASFRIACTDRRKNSTTGEWEDGDSVFLSCTAWNNAEAITEQLRKGSKIVVTGTLKQSTYQAKDGTDRTSYEVTCQDIALVIRDQHSKPIAPAANDPWTATTSTEEAPF
jgi:single-strand DNA-binding protein